ncbi:MAG TPA: Ldh family oxidoreductase [Thermoanaerobaculia bacterium]
MRAVAAETLAGLMTQALRRRGLSEEHAAYVVDGLVETSLRGVDTHGVRLFPTYLAELDGGRARARPELRWSGEGAARVLDAGGALGLVAGRVAADEAARLARELGVGAVSVRSSNHFGAAAVYTLAMARQGVLGLSFTNSDALVAPHGGRRPAFGTNPISMAARGAGGDLFCADFATSQVSYSKVRHHRAHGLPLEPGWVVDEDETVLKPLGGHKGQCLGMMVEILCAVVAGMPLDAELSHLYAPPYDEPRRVAHLFLALDPGAFRAAEAFRGDLSRFLGQVRGEPAVAGARVVAPGDLEEETAAARRRDGVPLADEEWAFFESLARPSDRQTLP